MSKYYCFYVDNEPYASLVGNRTEDEIGQLVKLKGGDYWFTVEALDAYHAVQLMERGDV